MDPAIVNKCISFVYSLAAYITESRNLKVISSMERRERLLKKGKANIISFLSSLPQTQHDLRTFVVDLVLFTVSITTTNNDQ